MQNNLQNYAKNFASLHVKSLYDSNTHFLLDDHSH